MTMDATSTNLEIEAAASRLAYLLRSTNACSTEVDATLSKIRAKCVPRPTPEESLAEQRVEAALAAQRAVALLRTEARLHSTMAERCSRVVTRLEDAERQMESRSNGGANEEDDADADNANASREAAQKFKRSVILPESTETLQQFKMARESADAAIQKEKEFVTLRRSACESVSVMILQTELRFNRLFVEALQSTNGMQSAIGVHSICSEVGKLSSTGRQLIPDGFSKSCPDYLSWLRDQAKTLLGSDVDGDGKEGGSTPTSEFKTLLNYLAKEFGGVATLAPLKGYKRTLQKSQDKYMGDFSRVLDLARGMVVFDSIEELCLALKHIKTLHDSSLSSRGKPLMIRAKDRLSPRFDASRYTGGYRDVLLNLCFSSGHIVECQLHVSSFLDLKNRHGHLVYENARSIHMFNEAFTKRRYAWLPDSDQDEVADLLDDIRTGALTSLNLDYSEALYSSEAQSLLADAFIDPRCRLRDISLRSCRCGDDFILKCLPAIEEVDAERRIEIKLDELWSPNYEHGHIGNTLRLGSKLHAGTAGRLSRVGIRRVTQYLNSSLREFDLEGCLDLDWYENIGDTVASTFVEFAKDLESKDAAFLLPQLQTLNLKSTGLTPDGMKMLQDLKDGGHLGQSCILTDEKLRTGPPRKVQPIHNS